MTHTSHINSEHYLKKLKQLDADAYQCMGRLHQLTMDMIQDFEIEVQGHFDKPFHKIDFITSARCHAEWILELMDKRTYATDAAFFARFIKICQQWAAYLQTQQNIAA